MVSPEPDNWVWCPRNPVPGTPDNWVWCPRNPPIIGYGVPGTPGTPVSGSAQASAEGRSHISQSHVGSDIKARMAHFVANRCHTPRWPKRRSERETGRKSPEERVFWPSEAGDLRNLSGGLAVMKSSAARFGPSPPGDRHLAKRQKITASERGNEDPAALPQCPKSSSFTILCVVGRRKRIAIESEWGKSTRQDSTVSCRRSADFEVRFVP